MWRPNQANGQIPRRVGRRLIVLATLAITGCGSADTPAEAPPAEPPARATILQSAAESHSHQEPPVAELPRAAAPSPIAESNLVDDDGKTLWDSPTHGRPLDFAYLPFGSQIILAIRPAEFVAHPEGEKVVAALGPLGTRAIQFVKQTIGIPLRDIEQLLVSWRVRHGNWEVFIVVTASARDVSKVIESRRLVGITKLLSHDEEQDSYLIANDYAYWKPTNTKAEGRILVVASPLTISDVLDLAGSPPPLRRDVESLLPYTDVSRQVTLLFAPSFLFSDGTGIFSGEVSCLRDPLSWLMGDDFSAMALSMHWEKSFFIELSATTTLDVIPVKAVNQLNQRLGKSPDRLAAFLRSISPSDYGGAVLARFPDMVRTLATYTRHRADRDHVELRCYLPIAAGQNLLMGAELTLAQSQSGGTGPSSSAAESGSARSVRERLQRHTSLRFSKDTLEAALQMLADDVDVEIVIRGADLQLDGITKNQSFGIDLADKPAEEILTQILRLANPDKTASGPADPKQKLVYIVEPKSPGGPEVVFVTTRAAAKKRGETLPAVFTAK